MRGSSGPKGNPSQRRGAVARPRRGVAFRRRGTSASCHQPLPGSPAPAARV